MNIAIIGSPLKDDNKNRGVGFYTKHLINNIKDKVKITDINQADLIHYPFFDPFKNTLKIYKKPTIVTVHDLIPIQFKKHFPVGIRGTINWYLQLYNLRHTSAIITVSQYSKHIIHQITKFPLDKIYVTYLGTNTTDGQINDKTILESIKSKYQLPDKFVFYLGDINWNKNVPSLIKICKDQNYPLVIAGGSAIQKNTPIHPWTKDLITVQNDTYPQKIGFVADLELSAIFNLATLYCQPSHAEGFGLPPLQAMACGCPVICNFKTSLPEVVGNAALPFETESFQKLWNSQKIRQKYVKLGLIQAKKFNWQKTAQKTIDVYAKYKS